MASDSRPHEYCVVAWLQSLDVAIFRFINHTVSNPVLDAVMPFFSGNQFFVPLVLLLAAWLLCKGGSRGRVFVLLLLIIISLGDMLVINLIKHAVARPRPFMVLPEVHLLAGRGGSASMPSSHTSTWFAAAFITGVFWRWSWRWMLPLAATVGLSRIYVGVHYPSDVLAGAILGAGYAAAGLWTINALWQAAGREWFPLWWQSMPSLLKPVPVPADIPDTPAAQQELEWHWLRLGYGVLLLLLAVRLAYQASGTIELSKDEAYQWLWSKHLALSYYSKPPMIAYTHYLGTLLWGDTGFGVRFFPPVIAAVLGFLMLRFMAAQVGARAAFWLILIVNCTPLMAAGALLMTIDPLLVLFWTASMLAGWRALQPGSRASDWLWVGLWTGLGFLSKYSAAYLVLCWAIFFCLHPPARLHLRRAGPWFALLISLCCTLPVVIWNSQHNWITASHVSENASLHRSWKPTLSYFWEFLGAEFGLLHPVFFVGAIWAMIAFWKKDRRNPLPLYLFSMGAPVFLGHWLFTLYARVLPNWIAPAALPMACLMVFYWNQRWKDGQPHLRRSLIGSIVFGYAAIILAMNTDLIGKIAGQPLPSQADPLRRVRGWKEAAAVVDAERQRLLAEGKPVFIIAGHYGVTSQLSFYLPEARTNAHCQPLVYAQSSPTPRNQFYFWPGYREQRPGQNAIFVREAADPKLAAGWFWRWLTRQSGLERPLPPEPPLVNAPVQKEFASVAELGVFEVKRKGRTIRRLQLFACRDLR